MDVSVVCPFFNEALLLERNVLQMLESLSRLRASWELIIVNDGSTDQSLEIAERIGETNPRLRVLSYPINRGRGYALRTGIAAARGEVIVTTEVDLSWGETIVFDLLDAMKRRPDVDIVVASPHLDGGGYRNVPWSRVFLSKAGNRIIRACMSNAVTMNTGMTRAYRRGVIQSLPLFENSKEFHLEVVLKASTMGYRITEIPATLEWPIERRDQAKKRGIRSSSINQFILSHSLFSLFGNPIRYIWGVSFIAFGLSFLSLLAAIVFFVLNLVSVYMALMSVSLFILAIVAFMFGVVVKQGSMVQREIWLMQSRQIAELAQLRLTQPESTALQMEAYEEADLERVLSESDR